MSKKVNDVAGEMLRSLVERFPGFIGDVIDSNEIRLRLTDLLSNRGMSPDAVYVQKIGSDPDALEFYALIVPREGNCLLRLTHFAVPVPGTKDGHIYTPKEIARIGGMDPRAIKSVLPADSGAAYLELLQPIVMSCGVPPDEMRQAMSKVCRQAEESDAEAAIRRAQDGVDALIAHMVETGQSETAIESQRELGRVMIKHMRDKLAVQQKSAESTGA